jgi:hypothetical protein
MIRLLDSCICLLAEYGVTRMLVDAIKGGEEGFQSVGKLPIFSLFCALLSLSLYESMTVQCMHKAAADWCQLFCYLAVHRIPYMGKV